MKKSSKKQKSKDLRIEFIEYTGEDKEERLKAALDFVVEVLFRKLNAENGMLLPKKRNRSKLRLKEIKK